MNINDLLIRIEEAKLYNTGSFVDCKKFLKISDDIYELNEIEQILLFFSKINLLHKIQQQAILYEIFGEYI